MEPTGIPFQCANLTAGPTNGDRYWAMSRRSTQSGQLLARRSHERNQFGGCGAVSRAHERARRHRRFEPDLGRPAAGRLIRALWKDQAEPERDAAGELRPAQAYSTYQTTTRSVRTSSTRAPTTVCCMAFGTGSFDSSNNYVSTAQRQRRPRSARVRARRRSSIRSRVGRWHGQLTSNTAYSHNFIVDAPPGPGTCSTATMAYLARRRHGAGRLGDLRARRHRPDVRSRNRTPRVPSSVNGARPRRRRRA